MHTATLHPAFTPPRALHTGTLGGPHCATELTQGSRTSLLGIAGCGARLRGTADAQNTFTRPLSDVRFGTTTPKDAAEATITEVNGMVTS